MSGFYGAGSPRELIKAALAYAPGSFDALCAAQPTRSQEMIRQRGPMTFAESATMMNVRSSRWFLTGFRRTALLRFSVEWLTPDSSHSKIISK